MMAVAAGVALFAEPEVLRSYEWVLYSDNSWRLEPHYPDYPMTPECVGLLATAGMLLAAILRVGRQMPLPLLGAWVLFVPLSVNIGYNLAGYPESLVLPVFEWPELMLVAAGGGVVLAGWWVGQQPRGEA